MRSLSVIASLLLAACASRADPALETTPDALGDDVPPELAAPPAEQPVATVAPRAIPPLPPAPRARVAPEIVPDGACHPPATNRTWVGFNHAFDYDNFGEAAMRAEEITALVRGTACEARAALDPEGVLIAQLRARAMVVTKLTFTRVQLDAATVAIEPASWGAGARAFVLELQLGVLGWQVVAIRAQ